MVFLFSPWCFTVDPPTLCCYLASLPHSIFLGVLSVKVGNMFSTKPVIELSLHRTTQLRLQADVQSPTGGVQPTSWLEFHNDLVRSSNSSGQGWVNRAYLGSYWNEAPAQSHLDITGPCCNLPGCHPGTWWTPLPGQCGERKSGVL